MLSLYEMSQEWENVFEMLLDPDIPEEAVFDTMKATGRTNFKTALERYGIQIREV